MSYPRQSEAASGRAKATLTPKQELAALALAGGASHAEAAAQAKSGERTVRTWLATRPEFNERILELRGELTVRAVARLAGLMTRAADTLGMLLDHTSGTVRANAARSILELAVRLRESVEFENRLRILEGRST